MKCMFAAMTCFLDQEGSLLFVPPSDESTIQATFMFVFDSVEKNIIASHNDGFFSTEQYKDALRLCKEESSSVFEFFKKSLTIK